jgi:DNA-binding HxlR family transcriptional regulator
MILDLLAHKDYLRILIALEDAPRRFSELQRVLDLNPAQVDRGLKFLRKGLWIVPRTLPTDQGPIRVEYELGKRGRAFLKSFERFRADLERQASQIGRAEVEELQRLSV